MKLQFGFARECINPEVPVSLAGYFNRRMWDRVLDDIEVRAVVLERDGVWAALVQFDLVTVTAEIRAGILDGLATAGISQIGSDNLLVTATHTHTAPEVRSGKPGSNPAYPPFAAARAVKALRQALATLHPGEALQGKGFDARFLFNRRYWMKNGAVLTNPGKLNPGIVRPEGEIDPEIPLFAIRAGGRVELVVANIVNHGDTIGGNGVSADWCGFFHRAAETALGPDSMAMPLIGCAGNINHFDVTTDRGQTCYAEAERIGRGYADSVLAALKAVVPVSGDRLKVVCRRVPGGLHRVDPAELAAARKTLEKYADLELDVSSGADLTSEDLARQTPYALKYFAHHLLASAQRTTAVEFILTGIMLGGSTVVASLPSEPFVEIGLRLRKGFFAGANCLVCEHGNGTGSPDIPGGYIPNVWNYGRGGYETTPRSNPYAQETSETLLNAWQTLAAELKK